MATTGRFEEKVPATTGRNRCQVAFHLPAVHGSVELAIQAPVPPEPCAAPHERPVETEPQRLGQIPRARVVGAGHRLVPVDHDSPRTLQ